MAGVRQIQIGFNAETGKFEVAADRVIQKISQINQGAVTGAQRAAAQYQQTATAVGIFDNASGRLAISQRNVGTALQVTIGQLGAIGPVANLAANAITTMAIASGPAGIALAALAATVGFLVYRIGQAKERLAELAEIQLTAIAREQKGLQFDQDIRSQLKVLQSVNPELEETRQKMAKLRIEAEKLGVSGSKVDELERRSIAKVLSKQAEEAARKFDELQKKLESLRASTRGETAGVLLEFAKLSRPELVADLEKIFAIEKALTDQFGSLAAATKNVPALGQALKSLELGQFEDAVSAAERALERLDPVTRQNVKTTLEYRVAIREATTAETQRAAALVAMEAVEQAVAAQREQYRQEDLDYLQKKLSLEQKDRDFQLQKLQATGAPENIILAERLRLLNEQRQALQQPGVPRTPGDLGGLNQQIELAETQLQRMGQITINLGQHVGNTLNDIFTALITGTLKSVDIGKAALATVGRIATDAFQQVITKKLAFEVTLFDNLKGLPGQASNALAAGAVSLPGGGGGGIGGFFSSIFGGGGNQVFTGPGGMQSFFPFSQGGGTSGGGGGGFLSGLSNVFQSGISGLNDIFRGAPGFGSIFSGAPGSFGGGAAGSSGWWGSFGASNADFGGGGGMLGNIGGFDIGGGIIGGIMGLAQAGLTGGFNKGSIGGTIGSTVGGIIGSIWGPLGSFIGSIFGKLLGGLFDSVPNPTVVLRAKFSGIFYDALTDVFKPGTVTTNITKTQDIASGVANQVKSDFQLIVERLSKEWTNILNIFPREVREGLIPLLDDTNRALNQLHTAIKFSEGGSRTIAEEMAAAAGIGEPQRFFFALRKIIGQGFVDSLKLAGLGDFSAGSFTGVPEGATRRELFKLPGLTPPRTGKKEDIDAFVQALQTFAGITGGLASVSKTGVTPFLTEVDQAVLTQEIQKVLGQTKGTAFTGAVEDLEKTIKPVLDFLEKSVGQTQEIFSRGLIAALEAATESQAQAAFLQSLGQGAKDIIFQGITEAFIASAQFNDLLAPIQKTIRDFTQEAIASGLPPDIDAFRTAILPQIEDLGTRAETLAPLVAQFQKIGDEIIAKLGGLTGTTGSQPIININIAEFSGSDQDVRTLAGRLDDLLRGQLAPN